ncbi:unnamed protein product [Agarophyton chilense]
MSESTPPETPPLTAAEKAEIRRRKILAKKNARMAYAAGKRTCLPSDAPSEPTDEVTQEPSTASSPQTPAESTSVVQRSAANRSVAAGPHSQQRSHGATGLNGYNAMDSAVVSLKAKVIRLTMLTLLAVVYTAALTYDYLPRWRVSAVEVFLSAELCLLVPRLIDAINNRLKRIRLSGYEREAFPFTVLRLLLSIQDSVLLLRRIMNDFSVFMFVFLCTWYVVETL